MFEEEGSHYWILAILFVGAVIIISGLYVTGILKLDAPPLPPKNIQITQIQNSLKITWDKSPSVDVIGYNIYRSKQYSVQGEKINQEIIYETEFIDKWLVEDGTYYYLVRAVDNTQEDEGITQVTYYFDTAPPYGTIISINNGTKYTNTKKVKLNLESHDSYICRYKNEGGNWTDYTNYVLIKDWELIDEEGLQIVYYQCQDRNYNEGSIESDSIILDKTLPEMEFIRSIKNIYSEDEIINFSIYLLDNYPNNLSCYIYLNNTLIANQVKEFFDAFLTFNFNIEKQSNGTYLIKLVCEDEAGNQNIFSKNIKSIIIGEYRSKEVNITINRDEEITNNREVILYVNSKNANKCRYKNEEREWSEWEKYTSSLNWVLSSEEGIKTVYVECLNNINESLGINWDTIEYKIISGSSGIIKCIGVPSNLNIITDKCTNSLTINLKLSAVCADECTYREVESGIWRRWEDYRNSKEFSLSARYGEGIREIEYKCKNKYGESEISSAKIHYDITPPSDYVFLEANSQEDGKIRLFWSYLGVKEDTFDIYKKSLVGRTFNYVDNTNQKYWIDYDTYNEQEYHYYIVVKDCAGNEGITPSNVISIIADSEKPEISIYSPYEGEEFNKKNINLEFEIEDNLSYLITCQYQAGGSKKSLGNYYSGQYVSENIALSPSSSIASGDERIRIYLYCKDGSGNEEINYVSVIYIHETEIEEEMSGPGNID
ncbi:fibronectin type III domain-containing protein [Candidatus Micrarchaeota archaeon]|nr:fibronectin type III domain-containing protein [Candidatus Micrarchaeota archaeon]